MKKFLWCLVSLTAGLGLYFAASATGNALAGWVGTAPLNCVESAARLSNTLTVVPDPEFKLPCNYRGSSEKFQAAAHFCPTGKYPIMVYLDPNGNPLHACVARDSLARAWYANGIYTGDPRYTQPVTFAVNKDSPRQIKALIGFGRWNVMPGTL